MYNPMNTEAAHDDEKRDLGFFASLMVASIVVTDCLSDVLAYNDKCVKFL
jgi:hypothetical protein